MNHKMVIHTIGQVVLVDAGLLLLPLLVSIYYQESATIFAYFCAITAALLLGGGMFTLARPKNRVIFAREGFTIVSVSWLMLSLISTIPFMVSGDIPRFADAFFESVSGFTTTGASIVANVEMLSRGNLFWRALTHWIGGMGVLVLVTIIASKLPDRSMNILRAEMPGPVVGKLVSRAKDSARILYTIYVVMTIILIVLLKTGGMPWFDSVFHGLATAGTGGFNMKADSIAGYSPYLQWVITFGMLAFGVNFNIYFLMLMRRFGQAAKSTELWTYLGIFAVSTGLISWNIHSLYPAFGDGLRHAAFQSSSIITTTGFTSTDYSLWPGLSQAILLLLTFLGGCAGSTAGGLKISRLVIMAQMLRQEVRRMVHPRSISVVRYEGKVVDEDTQHGTTAYFALYILCIVGTFLLLSFEPFSMDTNFSAAVACFNNVGPGFDMVGPAGNFSAYSDFSKFVLAFTMLMGRLEIFPLLLTIIPSAWYHR
ncbi:MAG: TrkH family potassium uptake protein [Oscillospiraceae bacterium]|nr:TrkH family potassium uptake protein [Oscillospiraceae bacterium]